MMQINKITPDISSFNYTICRYRISQISSIDKVSACSPVGDKLGKDILHLSLKSKPYNLKVAILPV